MEAKAGDLIVAVSAAEQIPGTDTAALIAGQLRLAMAERLSLIPKNRWEFLWLTGFPLFEWSTAKSAGCRRSIPSRASARRTWTSWSRRRRRCVPRATTWC